MNNGADSAGAVTDVDGIVPEGEVLGVRFVPDEFLPAVHASQQLSLALFHQWALPDHRFRADLGDDDVGPSVFAPWNDPLFVATGARVLWTDPYSDLVLWFEVGVDEP